MSSAQDQSVESSTNKKITLTASDEERFEVDEAVAMEFGIVKSYLDDNPDSENFMPLYSVSAAVLAKLIKYSEKRVELRAETDYQKKIKEFGAEFVKDESDSTLVELAVGAHYLDMRAFLELVQQTVADRIKNKSVQYVRELLEIENDYSPDEEKAIRDQYEWAFDGVDQD